MPAVEPRLHQRGKWDDRELAERSAGRCDAERDRAAPLRGLAADRAEYAGAAIDVVALAAVRATREAMVARGREKLPSLLGTPASGEIANGETFTKKYGVWAIFLGRFFGPARAFVPLVAGIFEMPRTPFQIANVTSALLWAFLMLAPGTGFGTWLRM